MRNVMGAAPGVIWIAIILGLTAGATWIAEFYGNLAWVPPLVGFLTIVAVPILKVLATGEPPAGRGELSIAQRSKLARWLW